MYRNNGLRSTLFLLSSTFSSDDRHIKCRYTQQVGTCDIQFDNTPNSILKYSSVLWTSICVTLLKMICYYYLIKILIIICDFILCKQLCKYLNKVFSSWKQTNHTIYIYCVHCKIATLTYCRPTI